MLIYNGTVASMSPLTVLGMGWQNFVSPTCVMNQSNIEAFSSLSAYPDGNYPPDSMIPPRSAGRLRSNFINNGVGNISSAALQTARELQATTGVSGSGNISNANLGQLILLAASMSGSGNVSSATIQALANLLATVLGDGNVSNAAFSGLLEVSALMSGSGTITNNNTFLANLEANIVSFGELTPQGIRDAVWAAVLESGFSASDILRLIAAATQGSATGLEDGSPVFKGLDGTTDRIVATYSAGTRTVTSRDAG